MRVFIDTWGWVTLYNRREPRHAEVRTFYDEVRNGQGQFYTTDYVLDETYTLLFKRLVFSQAETFVQHVENAVRTSHLQLEWITRDRFQAAMALRFQLDDKPDISFTDLTSMVVMDALGLQEILTADSHFTKVGMGFRLRPRS
jgi:predicted nucleic acid-binding protein